MNDTDPVDVAVVGAGIAGLVVAAEAARAGLRVVVCESGPHVGGMLRPLTIAGVETDAGAESFATRTGAVAALIGELGLPLDIALPRPGGAQLVWPAAGGIDRAPLPQRTILGIPADPLAADVVRIVGADAAALAAAEPALPAARAAAEPDLHTLAATRLGPRVADLLVDPICRSVYSRPAGAARLSRLHPELWRRYREHGSLVEAAASLAPGGRPGSAVGGIRGGVWRLAAALADLARAHGARVRTDAPVTALRAVDGGHELVLGDGSAVRARRVVLAVDARAAARLIRSPSGTAGPRTPGEPAGRVESVGEDDAVAVVHVAVEAPGLDAFPVGSGVIVAPGTDAAAKALTHVNAKWPWVGEALPPGVHVLRLSAREAGAFEARDRAALAREVALLTGVAVEAGDIREEVVMRWPVAASGMLPAEVVAEAERRGIVLAGAAVAGTGLASVVPHARAVGATLAR
ncbi:protoporphyrinogen/coproporphyrinogen oxidase [Microbacterium sp.]|uniref:protoporphyrinogen/coproporphyrinogen oxidase n=1 Tax=Microbacterium sp. TaxID=51671 RepID=UPI0039E285DC